MRYFEELVGSLFGFCMRSFGLVQKLEERIGVDADNQESQCQNCGWDLAEGAKIFDMIGIRVIDSRALESLAIGPEHIDCADHHAPEG
jgi:hypothetical protein